MNCLLCGSDQQDVFERVESFGIPLVYYQCHRCGLVFQSAEESKAADPEFYTSVYREIYQATETPTSKDLWVQEQRAKHLMAFLHAQNVHRPDRALDIGASAGVLLKAFKREYACDVVGVEPGDAYRTFAEQQGLQMFTSKEELITSRPERFDLISLSHVLEHLPDPAGDLRSYRMDLLSESGLLLIEVPNFYAHDSYELAHLACYTPHTLREILLKTGYEVIGFKKHGVPRSACLNLYLTILARPAKSDLHREAVRPERYVRQKRDLGLLYRRGLQKLFPHKAWLPLPSREES